MSRLDGRIRKVADRLTGAKPDNLLRGPVHPDHLAVLDALENITNHATPEERQRSWPELLRLAARRGLKPRGYTDADVDEYFAIQFGGEDE